MKKVFKVIAYVFFIVIVLPILIINMTLIVKGALNPDEIPDFMGYKPFIVLSGSMESQINIGDLVIVKEVDTSEIKKNDIIAFRYDDIVITHRVVNVLKKDNKIRFKTKGDNNNTTDDFYVTEDSVEGMYVTKIDGLGNVFMFLSKPIGMMVVILSVIVIAGVIYFIIFKPSKEDKKLMREFEEYKRSKK